MALGGEIWRERVLGGEIWREQELAAEFSGKIPRIRQAASSKTAIMLHSTNPGELYGDGVNALAQQ